ncbi:MAG TPA: flagellar assembly peptidoglycan hydrolase FlgJ [Cellvibrio sp.]|nr:flagellar assembly peptidoglycan hydrolase FlgJ [Cellvibrio sp.]
MLPVDMSTNALANGSLLSGAAASKTGSTAAQDTFLDQNSLNSVKAMGRNNDPQALKEIAKKFEAMFVQQMLKSMRDASQAFSEGNMFSSNEEKFHQEMLDQQMVLNLTSGRGIGLAASMYQQMQRMQNKTAAPEIPNSKLEQTFVPSANKPQAHVKPVNTPPALISRSAIKPVADKSENAQSPEDFIASLMPFAEKAAAELNVNTDIILAQAALETGWGKHILQDSQGNSSFNIFNIKKSSSWDGKTIGINALEFKQGVALMERSEFRQYEGYSNSFSDYVDLLKNSPRYQRVLDAGNDSAGYAEALQKAGYATDPDYAQKLKSLLNSDVIRSAVDGKTATTKVVDTTRG